MTDARVADLQARLAAAANEGTRQWWNAYLKGAVPFRGVPMAGVRRVVHAWWQETGATDLARDGRLDLALSLFAEELAEDKLAGVLVLAEILLADLRLEDVPRLATPFKRGSIDEWSTCDWYCVKVLGPFVEQSPDVRAAAEAIAAWRDARSLWQRRAAAVAFVNLAPRADAVYPGFVALLLDVCAANVHDSARFSQTGVGWLLRELSRGAPDAVAAFVEAHAPQLSTEAKRMATARLRGSKHRR